MSYAPADNVTHRDNSRGRFPLAQEHRPQIHQVYHLPIVQWRDRPVEDLYFLPDRLFRPLAAETPPAAGLGLGKLLPVSFRTTALTPSADSNPVCPALPMLFVPISSTSVLGWIPSSAPSIRQSRWQVSSPLIPRFRGLKSAKCFAHARSLRRPILR